MAKNLDQDSSLPYSIEAEKAVLGGIMLKNDTWDLVAGLVIEDDFYQDEHKLIYRTINLLQDAGKPVDVITVQEAIEGNGVLQTSSPFIFFTDLPLSLKISTSIPKPFDCISPEITDL